MASLCLLLALAWAPTVSAVPSDASAAIASSYIEANQVADKLEILIDHPESQIGSLYIRQFGIVEGPIRLTPGENRYTYQIQSRGAPLTAHIVEIAQYASDGRLISQLDAPIVEPWVRPDGPTLALTPDDIRVLIKRYTREPRANSIIGRVVGEMDDALLETLVIPDEGGTWQNDYVCPDHDVLLESINLHEHECPVDQVIWTGQSFDQGLASILHKAIAQQAWNQAVVYTVTGDITYGQRVQEILLGYAAKYPGYVQHGTDGEPSTTYGGKAFGQTLDEAEWLTHLVRAADLLHGSELLDEVQTALINESIFRPGLEVIRVNNVGIHNIQCWQNTAIFLAAMAIGEITLADEAINGPTGLYQQFALGIDGDGMWYEGSFGYHFFTFRALLPMLNALRRLGPSYNLNPVESMLLMPLPMAFPNGMLVQLNDGPLQAFDSNLREIYEQAVAFFPRSEFCGPLVEYGRGSSLGAVIYGVADLPFQDWVEHPLVNYEVSGVAALKSSYSPYQSTLVLDYGPHGGFHGHHDKLGINMWRGNTPVFAEAGDIGVDVPMTASYYRTTLAHNTIVIDGENQAECTGILEHFFESEDNSFLLASADDAYEGVAIRRQVTMYRKGYAVDGVEVKAAVDRTIDYVLHSPGTILHTLPMSEGNLGYGGPYDFLSNVQVANVDAEFRLRFRSETGDSVLDFLGEPGTQVFIADAPGSPVGSTHQVLILRRVARSTIFAATVTKNGSNVDRFEIELSEDNPWRPRLKLTLPDGVHLLPFYPN